jgi:DnaK suppressor protein
MGKISQMDDRTANAFHDRLLSMLADLDRQDTRGHDSQKTVTLDQQSVGRLSRMDALQQQAMAKATQARRDQQKNRILAALERIAMQEFGYCLTCGEDINMARLDLDPTVPNCISCARG